MSKEKGTPAAKGTGADWPVIQKLHTTGEGNVKIKLNRRAARMLFCRSPRFLPILRAKMQAKGAV